MAMKVDGSLPAVTLTGSGPQAPAREKAEASGAPERDTVSLSSTSSQLRSLEARVNESSGLDTTRVESVKKAINEGSFNIDANRIADRLLAVARESLSHQKA